jgi:hypothetical protein
MISSPRIRLTFQIDNISNGENLGYIRGFAGHIDADETWKILSNVYLAV